MGRKCTIIGCNSKTTGPQSPSQGVITYHSFPIEPKIREKWVENCRLEPGKTITKSILVCSRHFRSSDFKKTCSSEDASMVKYWLKAGTVPTIFPWGKVKTPTTSVTSTSSSSSPVDTAETVKQTIAQIMAETAELNKAAGIDQSKETTGTTSKRNSVDSGSGSATKIPRTSIDANVSSTSIHEEPVFTVGTKIEAQDFAGLWHTAKVIEVDSDEKEVFIKYEKTKSSKSISMSDEWIPMNSSRLRPKQTNSNRVILSYVEGEKCLAKWQARKFPATVSKVLGNDLYEVIFDDGYTKNVKSHQMSKSKVGTPQTPESKKPTTSIIVTPKKETKEKEWNLISMSSLNMDELNLAPIPEDGEWCCYWVNDQPIGEEGFLTVGDHRKPTVIVQDWRLPDKWIKHMYQRSNVLGKWDVILVSPQGKRFRSKSDLKQFLVDQGQVYNPDIYDFSIHRRRSKDIGAYVYTKDYQKPPPPKPANSAYFMEVAAAEAEAANMTPNTSLITEQLEATPFKESPPLITAMPPVELMTPTLDSIKDEALSPLQEGFVYVGSLKVQLVDNLFKCPDENCSKTFRKENHFQIHVKHYHPALVEKLGACPNIMELAYKRTFVTPQNVELPKNQIPNQQFFAKMHLQDQQARLHRRSLANTPSSSANVTPMQSPIHCPTIHTPEELNTQANLLIMDQILPKIEPTEEVNATLDVSSSSVTTRRSGERKSNRQRTTRKFVSATTSKMFDDSFRGGDSEETRHSFNFTPDSQKSPPVAKKPKLQQYLTSSSTTGESTVDSSQSQLTTATIASSVVDVPPAPTEEPKYIQENGELIKIVRMRQEEIINCVCTYGEEDGLMIQCELCLCWQHGTCHGIEKESQVPEKYICYICRNPNRGRQSKKFIHDQEWMFDGRLPTASYHSPNPNAEEKTEMLKKSHTLTGNLIELKRFLHSLKVKVNIAENKDHPKLYLWSKDWESPEKEDKKIKEENPQMPEPEAAIDPGECQKTLIKHLKAQRALLQAKVNAIEEQVSELEKRDKLAEGKGNDFDFCKETLRFVSKDLDTMQKLANINLVASTAAQQYQQPVA
ncbi:PHF20 family protein [Megaselia abdita]